MTATLTRRCHVCGSRIGPLEPAVVPARVGTHVIVVKRPCAFAPGKWRSWRVAKNRLQPRELPAAVWVQVLVALDVWLDGGCKVMREPTRIDLPVKP